MTIIRNSMKCLRCGDEVESKHRHDYQTCSCGAISVDGGHDYLKRSCQLSADDVRDGVTIDYRDTSIIE